MTAKLKERAVAAVTNSHSGENKMKNTSMSRRGFIEMGCKIGVSAAAASLVGCSGGQHLAAANKEFLSLPVSEKQGSAVMGIYKSKEMQMICEEIVPRITDMDWLSPGDSVFVKVACNS